MQFENGSKFKVTVKDTKQSFIGKAVKMEGSTLECVININGKQYAATMDTEDGKHAFERLISVCDRCLTEANPLQMSRFNTEMCCPSCLEKEKAHPDYEKAYDKEFEEVKAGNYNYEGIGLPEDLKVEIHKEEK